MADWMMLMGAAAAALIGFAWLALAMPPHWEQVYGDTAPSQKTRAMLRVLGAIWLTISGILCFMADRPSMAALLWIMLMALGSLTIALTLAWRPWILRFAWYKVASSELKSQM